MDITQDDLLKITQARITELQEEVETLKRLLVAVDAFFQFNKEIAERYPDLAGLVAEASQGVPAPRVIDAYTRKQAIEDGQLVDVSQLAREAGLKFPTCITSMLLAELTPDHAPEVEQPAGQSLQGRLWDMFTVFKFKVKNGQAKNVIDFTFSVARTDKTEEVRVKGICGPGDDAKPVMTFMLADED